MSDRADRAHSRDGSRSLVTEACTCVRACEGGVELLLRVKPRAARTRLLGERAGLLELQLSAPPVDGAANQALLRFLSDLLGVPQRRVTLVSGAASRQKRVRVLGISLAEAETQLRQGALNH